MPKLRNPYTFFNRFCLRTPLLPLDFYHDLSLEGSISPDKIREIWGNDVIKEAVFLASPELFETIEKWLNNQLTDAKRIQRLKSSLLKYLSRMSSRCTPFGLFAGCSIGTFGDATAIELESYSKNSRQTRFDMNFLVAFSQKLSGEEHFKKQLLWYPNTSLYKVGKQYRYVSYSYNEHNRREHAIDAVVNTPYLEAVLEKARSGVKIKTLVALLTDDEITAAEAEGYLGELIESQILVSELEPSVTGEGFLEQLKKGLAKLSRTKPIVKEIGRFRKFMDKTDKCLGNSARHYIDLSESLKELDTPFELKYLFQTDMYTKTMANTLHVSRAYTIKRIMPLLNKISLAPEETTLGRFKEAFAKRYETREMPLATVLDTEIGIGYLQNRESSDSTPFLDDLNVPVRRTSRQKIAWNPVQEVLYQKLRHVQDNKEYALTLEDRDFENLEINWNDLPDTMSTMVELVDVDGKERAVLSNIGGSSAANLLGRFSTGNPEILEHVKHIIDMEKQMHPEALMAEIVHLPESRTGNVIRRAGLRDYEIPYLGKSHLPMERQLPVSDLMISIRRNRLILRSKKYNKEVIPRLTNAHNYSFNALPVYHFLCDMQRQGKRSGIGFSWGALQDKHEFLPRVIYKDFILSKARWKIDKDAVKPLLQHDKQGNTVVERVAKWRAERRLPRFVQLTDSDNTLLIDMEQQDAVTMWLDTVKNRGHFVLEEFLFTGETIVKQDKNRYTNQFVISFYNKERLHTAN